MLNPIEKFKVAILHLNRAWNHCSSRIDLLFDMQYVSKYKFLKKWQDWCICKFTINCLLESLANIPRASQ